MSLPRRHLLLLLALFHACACCGCIVLEVALGIPRPPPPEYNYLLKRDAKTITKWALEQNEYRRINDAFGALAMIAAIERRDVHDAVEGYVAVHSKLRAGWPGFTSGDPDETDNKRRRYWEYLVAGSYRVGGFDLNGRYVREIYHRIEPPLSAVEEHKAWSQNPTTFGSEWLDQTHTEALD